MAGGSAWTARIAGTHSRAASQNTARLDSQ